MRKFPNHFSNIAPMDITNAYYGSLTQILKYVVWMLWVGLGNKFAYLELVGCFFWDNKQA